MADSACFCGTFATAQCVRCGGPRCAEHYILKVWCEKIGGWAEQTPNGSRWLGLEKFGILGTGETYARGYAAGGPGCTTCREAAGSHARSSTREILDQFLAGKLENLAPLADSADVLTSEDYIAIAHVLAVHVPKTATLAHVRASPPPKGKKTTPVEVIDSEDVPWFSAARVAASSERGLFAAPPWRPYGSNEMFVVLESVSKRPSIEYIPAFRDGSDHYKVISGIEVSAVQTRKFHQAGSEALRSVAKELPS